MDLPEGKGGESQATASAEGATVVHVQPGAAPDARADIVTEGDGHQLDGRDSVDVARVGVVSPRRITRVVTNHGPVVATEVVATGELGLPHQERVPFNRLREEEVDLAGHNTVEPHWFWELLEEVGYDVW